jgi:A circularly permuted ATPgrasp
VRGGFRGTRYDEFLDADGDIRPHWAELAAVIGERGGAGLDTLRATVSALVDHDGITYIAVDQDGEVVNNGQGGATPGPWYLDALPLLVSGRLGHAGNRSSATQPAARRGIGRSLRATARRHQRGVAGRVAVRAPRLPPGRARNRNTWRAPTLPARVRHQQGYVGRLLGQRGLDPGAVGSRIRAGGSSSGGTRGPGLYERVGPRPVSPFAQTLRLALIDAAPEAAEDPVVVVLSPGINSETAFDQAYLASVLGFPLVESADLVVRDGTLLMRSLGTLKPVDVVLRRVDADYADYADPPDLRSDSQLGVVGLVEVQRRGAVTVVNTLGSGVLESPGLLRFLPEVADLLTGETPVLQTAPMYWGGIETEGSHLLSQLTRGWPLQASECGCSPSHNEVAMRRWWVDWAMCLLLGTRLIS